jgi:hypothetical protein
VKTQLYQPPMPHSPFGNSDSELHRSKQTTINHSYNVLDRNLDYEADVIRVVRKHRYFMSFNSGVQFFTSVYVTISNTHASSNAQDIGSCPAFQRSALVAQKCRMRHTSHSLAMFAVGYVIPLLSSLGEHSQSESTKQHYKDYLLHSF